MYRKKCFLIPLAYVVTLSVLIMSGLSCFSGVAAREVSTANGLPKTEAEFKSYITPEHPQVVETLHGILGAPPYEICQAGFDDIRDWVANNIDYMPDEKRWDVSDYWQTSEETLSSGTGDCEDFAILLCSFFRAYGIDAEQVYVALGTDDEKNEHAFLIEDWNYDEKWRRIEPQAPAQSSSYSLLVALMSNPDSRLDKYEITAAFNDLHYYDESFSWDKVQADSRTPNEIVTTLGYIAQRLSQLLGYLLGLLFS